MARSGEVGSPFVESDGAIPSVAEATTQSHNFKRLFRVETESQLAHRFESSFFHGRVSCCPVQ